MVTPTRNVFQRYQFKNNALRPCETTQTLIAGAQKRLGKTANRQITAANLAFYTNTSKRPEDALVEKHPSLTH